MINNLHSSIQVLLCNRALALFYILDMTISRAGISHAYKRLKKFYEEKK